MKGKVIGYVVSAAFVLLVVYIGFRVTAIRNLILGTTPSA